MLDRVNPETRLERLSGLNGDRCPTIRVSGVVIPSEAMRELGDYPYSILGQIDLSDALMTGKTPEVLPPAAAMMFSYAKSVFERRPDLVDGEAWMRWRQNRPTNAGDLTGRDIHYDSPGDGRDDGSVRLIAALYPGVDKSNTWFYLGCDPEELIFKRSEDAPNPITPPGGVIVEFGCDVLHAEPPIPKEAITLNDKRTVMEMTISPPHAPSFRH